MVINTAKAGLGSYSFVADEDLSKLKARVIDSLQKATEPSLVDCKFEFGIEVKEDRLIDPSLTKDMGVLFRNNISRCCTIMT